MPINWKKEFKFLTTPSKQLENGKRIEIKGDDASFFDWPIVKGIILIVGGALMLTFVLNFDTEPIRHLLFGWLD